MRIVFEIPFDASPDQPDLVQGKDLPVASQSSGRTPPAMLPAGHDGVIVFDEIIDGQGAESKELALKHGGDFKVGGNERFGHT